MNAPLRVPLTTAHPAETDGLSAPAPPARPLPLLGLLAGSLCAVVASGAVLAFAHLSSPPVAACASVPALRQAIATQEAAGTWSVAASTADLALTTPALCPSERRALLSSSLRDKLEALLAGSISLDNVTYLRNEVARYHALAERAAAAHITFPLPLVVARQAFALGAYAVAQDAYEQAARHGAFSVAQRDDLHHYAQAVYALGVAWTPQSAASTHRMGLGLLVTSWVLNACFHLGDPAPAQTLMAALGSDLYRWPAPAPSPLLATCRPATRFAWHRHVVRKESSHE